MSSVAFLSPQNAPKSLAASPDPLAGFTGPTSKEGKDGRGGEGKGAKMIYASGCQELVLQFKVVHVSIFMTQSNPTH